MSPLVVIDPVDVIPVVLNTVTNPLVVISAVVWIPLVVARIPAVTPPLVLIIGPSETIPDGP
jgi:hypothetical protein